MAAEEWVGRVIDQRYVVESGLGAGGMGVVLRAKHRFTGQTVALKVLKPELSNDPAIQSRFLAEAQAPNAIGHPGIVRVHDAGRDPSGFLYLVMELLEGRSLRVPMVRGQLGPLDASRIMLELLDALGTAHARGFVHRDLKPDNVFLVAPHDTMKLLDFGIAKVLDAALARVRTATGITMGTPAYMSPEQLSDAAGVDARTDLWACGVIMYEMLSGRLPFAATRPEQLLVAIATQNPDPIRAYLPQAPGELEPFFARALSRDPRMRFGAAAEMAHALTQLPLHQLRPAVAAAGPQMTPPASYAASHAGSQHSVAAAATPLPPQQHATPNPRATPNPAGTAPGYGTPPPGYPAAGTAPQHATPRPQSGTEPPPAHATSRPHSGTEPPPTRARSSTHPPPKAKSSPATLIVGLAAAAAVIVLVVLLATKKSGSGTPTAKSGSGSSDVVAAVPSDAAGSAATLPPPPPPQGGGLAIGDLGSGPLKARLEKIEREKGSAATTAPAPTTPKTTRTTPSTTPSTTPATPPVVTATPSSDAASCEAGCKAGARCGLTINQGACLGQCMSNPAMKRCTDLALGSNCNSAASCVYGTLCGTEPSGTASCRETFACHAGCGANQSCSCACVARLSPGAALLFARATTCTSECGEDVDCLMTTCRGPLERCLGATLESLGITGEGM